MAVKKTSISSAKKEIIIAVIGLVATISTGFLTYLQGVSKGKDDGELVHTVPPNDNVTKVEKFPADESTSNFTLLRDVSIYDLRAWKPVTENAKKRRESNPVII